MENDEYLHDVDYDSKTIYSGFIHFIGTYPTKHLNSVGFVSMYYSARGGESCHWKLLYRDRLMMKFLLKN